MFDFTVVFWRVRKVPSRVYTTPFSSSILRGVFFSFSFSFSFSSFLVWFQYLSRYMRGEECTEKKSQVFFYRLCMALVALLKGSMRGKKRDVWENEKSFKS